jgi:hypothetical protein
MKEELTMASQTRSVILYELNEVPWSVVDYYVEKRPDSNLAALVKEGQSLTTKIANDDLQPWRTWPTFHTSMYGHNSYDLGQDPSSFRGEPLWDVAERAGLSVGLFGALQSWPPRPFKSGGFFVPDTFAQDAKAYPPALQRFQEFNLSMTSDNNFTSDAPLSPKTLLGTGVDLIRQGLTPKSAVTLASHLASERKDKRYKSLRPSMQVLPSFDLFWRLHRKNQPRLSVFFTNHVASMMHRFWGDTMPGYTDANDYVADDVFGSFIIKAMDFADGQLGRIRRYLKSHPDTVLVVAASMGQGPVESNFTDRGLFIVESHDQLVSRLGLKPAEPGRAMYPHVALVFADADAAQEALAPLESVTAEGGSPIFGRFRVEGKTVTFGIPLADESCDMSTLLEFTPVGATAPVTGKPAEVGLGFRARVGGDNTGYHVPEGMLLAVGGGLTPDASRREVDVLDVAPSLLVNVLGVEAGPTMEGSPSLFAVHAAAQRG